MPVLELRGSAACHPRREQGAEHPLSGARAGAVLRRAVSQQSDRLLVAHSFFHQHAAVARPPDYP
jgi:hypothetical protein